MNTEERIMATAKATAARAGNDSSGLREPLRLPADSRPGPGSHSSASARGAGRAVLWVLVVLLALTAGAAGAYLLLIGL